MCSSEEKKTEAGDDDVLKLKFALGWISFISALVALHAAFQNSKVNMNLSSQRCYRVQFGWSVSCVSFWVLFVLFSVPGYVVWETTLLLSKE